MIFSIFQKYMINPWQQNFHLHSLDQVAKKEWQPLVDRAISL